LPNKRYFGIYGAARSWLVSRISHEFPQITLICRSAAAAEGLLADLRFFVKDRPVLSFPAWDTLPFEHVSPQIHISAQRLLVLGKHLAGESCIVVAPVQAILQRVIAPQLLKTLPFSLTAEDSCSRESLLAKLSACGFRKVTLVEDIGEMAVRGEVIDFFPSGAEQAVRVEFSAAGIGGLRLFDVSSQRSVSEVKEVNVFPVQESLEMGSKSAFSHLTEDAVRRLKERGRELEVPPQELARAIHSLKISERTPGAELNQAIALSPMASYFDYLSNKNLILDNASDLEDELENFWSVVQERETRISKEHTLIPTKEALYLTPEGYEETLGSSNIIHFDRLELAEQIAESEKGVNIKSFSNAELSIQLKSKVGTGEGFAPLLRFISKQRRLGYSLAFVVGSKARAERLQKILLEIDIDAPFLHISGNEWQKLRHKYPVAILEGLISAGSNIPGEKLSFISEHEIFSERSYKKSKSPKINVKKLLGSLSQLKENDFLVHVDYGIGIYRGLVNIEVEGVIADFLHLDYADSRLYLPIQHIGKVQKFMASEGMEPKLDKLGSQRWLKTKQKVRHSVEALAGDLIKLYASRSVAKGWRFEPYGAEDERFADLFPYEETPDQLSAIKDTISDMARPRPMDRLVCGDVGFGKTEVALRAAYKCLQHGRQVALLAPTTILVEQHSQSFASRFSDYPVNVKTVSRFSSSADNKETLKELAAGEVDIIIGTHRLLSHDVSFKDLGLLIIDEEHRFGVKQKERLKQFKKNVDVLTLTATPIPRTLHMSLLELRDTSIISTPPSDRRVIRTYISPHNETLVRDAILRELQRGGQCFFVHNRVQSIASIAAGLQTLVPEARFEFAHGQMTEARLEPIMMRFLKGDIDVLVSTTIIESGIDIPNANTIIIDRADMYGLAQLYQLRGRVGRSDRQAYAYFIVPPTKKLGAEAHKRLKVLQSLDDLGLGFNLAIRDLEIRGAGNLLGKEQSGSVLAVGFDLYTKILKEAVLNLKGEQPELAETIDPEVKMGVSAYIPETYVPDISERLVLYQRLAGLTTEEEADDLAWEIEDRFGSMGEEVQNLIELMRFRVLLKQLGIVKAELTPKRLSLVFSQLAPVNGEKIVQLIQENPGFKFTGGLSLTIKLEDGAYKQNGSAQKFETPADIYNFTEELVRPLLNA